MCFWVLKNGLPIYASPPPWFLKEIFFPKKPCQNSGVFFNIFFWGGWRFAQRISSKRVFFCCGWRFEWFDVVDQMVGLVSTYGAHSQWEWYLHAGAAGSKGDSFFFFFFRKFVKKKQLGGVMLCDVWGVQTSEIFNNSTFSSQDRSCCQSLWVESRYSICTWDISK